MKGTIPNWNYGHLNVPLPIKGGDKHDPPILFVYDCFLPNIY